MGADTQTLVSTTDSEADVMAALGAPPAEKPKETPPADPPTEDGEKPAAAAAPPADAPTETAEEKAAREKKVSAHERRKAQIQAEIDEATRQKHQTRRDVEAEEARLTELKAQREAEEQRLAALKKPDPPAPPAPPVVETAKPKLEDTNPGTGKPYEYDEWAEAVIAYEANKAKADAIAAAEATARKVVKESQEAEAARIEQTEADRANADRLRVYATRVDEFKKTHADFDAVTKEAADVPTTPPMEAHIIHSEMGPALIYHFATHPEDAERIAQLSPARQLVELGKLEARLEGASKETPARPQVTHETPVPPPITPVRSGPTATSTVSPDDEDFQTYKTRRNAEERARRGI